MPYGLYLSADGVNVQSKRLEMLSNNLANVDTVGFKREFAVFQARASEAQIQGLDTPGSKSLNDISGGVKFLRTMTDFSQGAFTKTGNNTDLAIAGDGFFQVQRDGKNLLTRSGNFSIDDRGRMVTQHGEPVLSSSGTPILLEVERGAPEIGDDGVIYQFDGRTRQAVADIGLVKPQSLDQLVKQGDNLFLANGELAAVPAEARRVRSGFLEQSSTRATEEMMQLIETTRLLEANVNMIRSQDQVIGTLVGRALRV